jgi:uncharacterized protein involved in exopolysaccharide biosynthesis
MHARSRWPLVLGWAVLGGAVAGGTALLLPSYYRSGAAFQTESSPQTQLTGALAGIASQFGNFPIGSPQNSPQFFGDLLTTDAVLHRVAHARYSYRGQALPLATIYEFDDMPQALRDFSTVKKLRAAIGLDVNARTGVVRFTVEARDPGLAQALAETTLAALNQANIELRRARAAAEHEFTDERAATARAELDSAEQALAAFYQRNRSISSSPDLQMSEARRKRAVEMAQQVYVQLRMQAEQAQLQEVRNTPVVSVIDPPLVPVRRSRPNRRLAVGLGLMIGFAVAVTRLLLATPRPL